ncbi:MAG TPA: hypothetical protein VF173_27155 [Thermoanaerobaculia bacterium]|nr:hypothetical protein [Thermoanaerobaculia bacterium]
MTTVRRLCLLAGWLLLVTGAILTPPKQASAIATLTYHWDCSPPDGVCDFSVTSNNHAMYQWNFGDGTSYGPTTSKTVSHDYNFSGSFHDYSVTLAGYATNPPGSPDNIIGCTAEAQGPSPGGNPGDHGNCS